VPAPRLYAGTSGYSYPGWRGSFYPERLPASRFLAHYAERLPSVEINHTFYRFPGESLLDAWRAATPEGFRFAVKANQGITHRGRLAGVAELTRDFVERCRRLGDKLGPILFQLPPHLRRDDARLDAFVASLPAGTRYAIEFRHASWFEDAVFERLRRAGIALCVSEGEELAAPRLVTADFCYLRLRRPAYAEPELRDWREWISGRLAEQRDVFAYLKHDEQGGSPETALDLLRGGREAARDEPAPTRRRS
jgi:uncharacterized protein YecE (DUF72 family)